MTLACGIQSAADGELQLPEPVEQGGALAAGYRRQVCIREPHPGGGREKHTLNPNPKPYNLRYT